MDHAPEAAARSLHCTARPARWRQGAPDAARSNMGSGAAHDELESKSSRRVVDRLCTCRYSLRKAGEKATVDVETSVARESESNETRAASTPSTDVPDIMPMYSRDIMMRSACDATLELISLTKHLSGRCQSVQHAYGAASSRPNRNFARGVVFPGGLDWFDRVPDFSYDIGRFGCQLPKKQKPSRHRPGSLARLGRTIFLGASHHEFAEFV